MQPKTAGESIHGCSQAEMFTILTFDYNVLIDLSAKLYKEHISVNPHPNFWIHV